MSDELKPCPFCGGNAYELEREQTSNGLHGIICGGCDVRVFSTKNEARAKWNRRQPEAKALTPDELWKIIGPFCQFTHTANDAKELCLKIHDAMPPDQTDGFWGQMVARQNERIKELEAEIAARKKDQRIHLDTCGKYADDLRTAATQRDRLLEVLADEHEISRLLFQDLSKNWTENDKKSSIFSHPENCPVCNLIARIRGESDKE